MVLWVVYHLFFGGTVKDTRRLLRKSWDYYDLQTNAFRNAQEKSENV